MKNNWFILDFFGHSKPHKELLQLGLDKLEVQSHYLTAYPESEKHGNTFLGFFVEPLRPDVQIVKKVPV
eukprot:UN22747